MINIENLSDNEKKSIEELRKKVKYILKPCMIEDTSLFYRFLKARDFNVNEAESMLKKHIYWRKLYQIDTILEDYTPREFFMKFIEPSILGFDKEGSLVLFSPAGLIEVKDVEKSVEIHKYMKYWAWYLEKLVKYSKEQNNKNGKNHVPLSLIMDVDKLTIGNATNKKTAEIYLNITNLFQNNYPEYLKALYVINAPTYAKIVYKFVKTVMSNAMIQKIHIFGYDGWKEKLLEVMDADVLPAFLGGNRTDPDGDPLCKSFVKPGGRIPPEYFLSEEERYFKNRSDVKRITVPKMEKKRIMIDVKEQDSIIRWEFYTKSNINFGLYRDISLDLPLEEVIPLSMYDTSDGTEKDSYKARIPGEYVIIFDNSYSWKKAKEVEYVIQIIQPE